MTSFRSYRIVKKKKNRKTHTQTHCNCRVLESYAAGTCYKRVHNIILSLSLFPAIYYFSRSISVVILSLSLSLFTIVCALANVTLVRASIYGRMPFCIICYMLYVRLRCALRKKREKKTL